MKRWAWLGFVGLMACHDEAPSPPPEPPSDVMPRPARSCPFVGQGTSSPLRAMSPAGVEEPRRDGREPVLVRFRPGALVSTTVATRAHRAAVERVGGHVRHEWPRLHALAARLRPEERQALTRNPDVLAIEPDGWVHAAGLPSLAGSAGEHTEGLRMIHAPQVWDADGDGTLDTGAPTGEGLQVCVIDSGWDERHPELQAAYAGGRDFIEDDDDPKDYSNALQVWGEGHGTHVAALIAARPGSGGRVQPGYEPGGMVGVAPGASLLIARVLDIHGRGRMSDVIEALQWCRARGARIASLSIATEQPGELARQAFEDALSTGLLPIAASGNAGTSDPQTSPPISYPAAYPSVLAVGAVDPQGHHAPFSQSGPELGLVAPGVDVLSATLLGTASCSGVEAGGRGFVSRDLDYAGQGDYTGPLMDCGTGDNTASCGQGAPPGGFIALLARGDSFDFARKVTHVMEQGARAVILINQAPEQDEGSFSLGAPGTWPPVVSVSQDSGTQLQALAGRSARVRSLPVDYARLSGTSMATAYVSGTAALVWSARPDLTPTQVRELLQRSARELGTPGHNDLFGWGLVQAFEALELLADTH
ncbi:S8 family serine peptidase [Archangium sp.]|uniref:S8 family serine peptidase n=1 Tax=Archangium sp. TaxID=1872627 RepID=UPI002D426278|nr:S8 family serine peptidase [Archangium sp.]HYO59725.1 S8 family serine peptidase [Archangium sp.]